MRGHGAGFVQSILSRFFVHPVHFPQNVLKLCPDVRDHFLGILPGLLVEKLADVEGARRNGQTGPISVSKGLKANRHLTCQLKYQYTLSISLLAQSVQLLW